ncbi:MAG TPA: permease prefix domain 1-containing protein [Pirellulales bacterium]|nr:permease prefix domain 1-containing protein [Pirellulales bacterium]
MKALKIEVERVVRPIQASGARKDRMREELLAHLTQLYEEELARSGDPDLAVGAAIGRFGDAATLSREMQASVSRLERFTYFQLPMPRWQRRRLGESPLHYILRLNTWAAVITLVAVTLLGLPLFFAASRRPHRADQVSPGQAEVFLIGFAAIQAITIYGWALLGEAMRRALVARESAASAIERRRAFWRIVGFAAANAALSGIVTSGALLLFVWVLPIDFVSRKWFWSITLTAMVAGPPMILLQGRDQRAAVRRFDDWESLDLDEVQPG